MIGRLSDRHVGCSHTLPDGRDVHAAYSGEAQGWAVTLVGIGRVATSRDIHGALAELLEPGRRWPDWFTAAASALSGVDTPDGRRFGCPCCGYLGIDEPPTGTYDICNVCGWEDDGVQFEDPDYRGGANHESLNEARTAFQPKLRLVMAGVDFPYNREALLWAVEGLAGITGEDAGRWRSVSRVVTRFADPSHWDIRNPDASIGRVLIDEGEASAVRSVAAPVLAMIDSLGLEALDREYLSHPRWPDINAAATIVFAQLKAA